MANNTGIRINEIPVNTDLDGETDLVHVYKKVGDSYESVSTPLCAVAFQGPKGDKGEDGIGVDGRSVAQLTCYRRFNPSTYSDTQIKTRFKPGSMYEGALNDGGSFNFSSMTFTPPTGWYKGVPPISTGQEEYVLYSCTGVAVSADGSVDSSIVWSEPESAGKSMQPGRDGKSTYQAVIFTRSATVPERPYGGYFDFGTDTLGPPLSGTSGIDNRQNPGYEDGNGNTIYNQNDWYVDTGGDLGPPDVSDQLWMCNQQFAIQGDTGADVGALWSIPTRFATDGANGVSTYYGSIYKRTNADISQDQPGVVPNGTQSRDSGYYDFRLNKFVFSYTDDNGVLVDLTANNEPMEGWSEDIPEENPSNRETLWVSHALATSNASFLRNGDVQDRTLQWSSPVKIQTPAIDGDRGALVAQVRAFLRAEGDFGPSINQLSAASFDFETKLLDLGNSGWSLAPYKTTLQVDDPGYGYDNLWVSIGVATSTPERQGDGSFVYPTDTEINWSDAVPASEDGEAARSTYLAQIYTRTTSAIDTETYKPTGGSFNFNDQTLTVPDMQDGLTWSANIPGGFDPIYVSQRNFSVLGNAGTDVSENSWSIPALLAYNGAPGASGISSIILTLYYGSDTELVGTSQIPNFPEDLTLIVNLSATAGSDTFGKILRSEVNGVSANVTNNQILSGTDGTGWYTQLPDKKWIYATQAVAADSDASDDDYHDTVAGTEWSDTVVYRRPGAHGFTGLGTATVQLYKRTNSTSTPNPTRPNGDITYYLGTVGENPRGTIGEAGTTTMQGWTQTPPNFNGSNHYLWQITAVASSRENADTIEPDEWSEPIIFSQNPFDLTETTVSHIVEAYKRSSTLPTDNPGSCTVNLSGELAGQIQNTSLEDDWSATIPDGDDQVYIVHATAAGNVTTITDTDTVEANEWSSPAKWGIVGEQGERGIAGNVAKIITLYKRTTRNQTAVTKPVLDGNYDFNAETFTFEDPNNETWTLEIPANQVNDKILWQTFATALCSQEASTYTIEASEWKTPKAVIEDGTTITPVFSSNFDGVSASLDSVYIDGNGAQQDHTHINFSDEYESIDSSQILTKTNGDTIAANTLTFIKIKGEQGPSGTDGSSTVTIFSDVENPTIGTDNLSYTQTTGSGENLIVRNFVVYINVGPNETYESKNDLDLTDNSNQTFIDSLNFGNIKGPPGVSVSSITRASNGLVTIDYDDDNKPDDIFTIVDGADVSVTDVYRDPTTGVVTMTFSSGGDQTFDLADGVGIGSVTATKTGSTTTVRIENDNGTLLREFDILDGLPGVKGRVLVVYAEDADGTNPSTTIGSREFVKYHEYEGDTAPNISDFTANTGTLSGGFVQFIGPQGITNSIFPIYADDATGTNATVDASSNKPFVTFVESNTPITNSNIPSGQTYVKYVGSDGTSVTIQGSVDNQSDLDNLEGSASVGDSYIGTDAGNLVDGALYVFDGTNFNNVGTIQGPVGNPGKNATPIYSSNSNGTDASLTSAAGKTFIAFYNFAKINPQDSDIPGGLTFTNFKGTGITSVEKVGTTVTVKFSDGNSDTFTVNDGASVSVTDVYRDPTTGVVTMTFSSGGDQTFDLADGVGIGSVTALPNDSGTGTTVRIENDNGTLLREFDIADGLPGVKGRVLVVYADDASGTNASTTIGTRTFVKYFEYEGDNTPSATTAASGGGFVQFIGPEGPIGDSITPIYATNASGSGATLTQTATTTFVNFFEGKVDTIQGTTLKFNNQTVGSLPSSFVNLKGQKGDKGDIGPVGSVPIFASNANGDNASLTQTSSTPFVFFYTGGAVASDTDLKLLGSNGAWTKIAGDSLYIHVKYADRVLTSSDSNSDMTDDPTGKKYIGVSYNNTSSNESTSGPGDFSWSLIQGNPGLPDGCQAVYGYSNSDGPSSITYLEDENVLQIQPLNNDTAIGMVYPAVDVTDGRTVQFTVSYKTPDDADNNGVYIRVYEATTDLAEGKDRVGDLKTGTNRTVEQDNSPLIQAKNRQHFWENGAAQSTQGGPGITVTPSNVDLEDGPVSNEYKTVTITFEPDASSKYISLTILNWAGMGNKRLWVKPVRTTIVGAKGSDGAHGITNNLVEIYKQVRVTEKTAPAVPSGTAEFNIADGSVSNLNDGWSVVPNDARSGYKIYRSVANAPHAANLTSGPVNIATGDWSTPKPWSVGNTRTAPVVGRIATYNYFSSDYKNIQHDESNGEATNPGYYSFRKSTGQVSNAAGVKSGWGNDVTDSEDPITAIGQILFTNEGKNNVDNSNFWAELNQAGEFLWKYGASWILFQRKSLVDNAGVYRFVEVGVLDHSEDIQEIKDLPGFYNTTASIDAEVVFGYTPLLKSETIYLYQRNNIANFTNKPSSPVVYNFDTRAITTDPGNNWKTSIAGAGTSGKYLWVTQATAAAKLDVDGVYKDEIPTSEWSTPTILVQDGSKGDEGGTYFQKLLYTRTSTSTPQFANDWTGSNYRPLDLDVAVKKHSPHSIGDVTDTTKLSSNLPTTPTVWYEDIPSESLGQFIWVIIAPVISDGTANTYTITSSQWAEPVILAKDGKGLNSDTVRLYKRTSGEKPDNTNTSNKLGFYVTSSDEDETSGPAFIYTFDSGNLDRNGVNLNGWTTEIPDNGGSTLWISRAVASGAGVSDTISWDQWQAPERLVSDGAPLVFINAFKDRAAYQSHIIVTYISGIPPVNSYHIENKIPAKDNRRGSFLYIGDPNEASNAASQTGIYKEANFVQLTVDGLSGQTGQSIVFKGTKTSSSQVTTSSLEDGDVYRFTAPGNGQKPGLYVFESSSDGTGSGWELLTLDGSDGGAGTNGVNGNSVFICYNTDAPDPSNPPTKPPANSDGNYGGNTTGYPNTWTTDSTTPGINWMSQKVAQSATDPTVDWGTPILVGGKAGEPGKRTFNITIYQRSESPPSSPQNNEGAYDFVNDKLLVPVGWSSSIKNAGCKPKDSETVSEDDPRTAQGYEWVLPASTGVRDDSSSWAISGIDNETNKMDGTSSFPLWYIETVVTATVGTVGGDVDQYDTDINWPPARLYEINGADLVDDSVDADRVYGVVKNGGGVAKIVATDRKGNPLTQEAYDFLAIEPDNRPSGENDYGWLAGDILYDDTLYLIF